MEEESGSLGVVPMSSAEQESSSLVGEDVAETRDEQNDEIDASAAALAERAKASSNVTSFIVSNESAVGPAALPQRSSHEQQDGNVVEPVVGEDDEDEDQYSSGKPVEVKASVKEPPVTPADDQTCTMRGEIGDQGRVVGRWGMTRDALNDVDQTSKFEYKRKVVRGAAPIAELSSYEPHALAVRLSGPYVGYFLLRVVNKAQPLKVEERTMTLVFSINTDDRFNIRGGGKNRYGDFRIEGTCSFDGSDLELYRTYPPKPAVVVEAKPEVVVEPTAAAPRKSAGGKDLMRVQAALKDVPTKPPSAAASSTRASAVQKKKSQPSLGGGVVGSQTPVSQRFDNESMSAAKRSARARKAPTKLGEGGVGSKSSAAVQQLPEPLRKCHAILCTLERAPGSQWFNVPVDPAALGVIHYPTIVPSPMDLGTVKRRLEDGDYADVHALAADVRLVFRNALTFNVLPEAQVHQAARDLLEKFEDALKGLWKQLAAPASASTPNGLSGGKRRDVHYDDEDDSFGAGGKRPRSSGKQSTGSKKSGKGKKGPRTPIGDDDVGTGGMVPIEHLTSMREQMESMQATILELQRQAAKTDIEVQMNRELAVAPQTAAQKAAQRRALLMKKELTYEEKTQLSTDINSLPPEKVGHVVKIVQDRMPLTSDDNDAEVEIDLEALDTETLRHLQNYVRNCLKRRGGGSGSRGSKKAKKGGQSPATTPVPTTPAPTTYDTPSSLLDSSPQALEALGGGLGAGFGSDDEDDDDIASSLA